MKKMLMIFAALVSMSANAMSMDDFAGTWKRTGVRCEGQPDVIPVGKMLFEFRLNSFKHTSYYGPNDLELWTEGDLASRLDPRGDRLDIRIFNLKFHDEPIPGGSIRDYYGFPSNEGKVLTLRFEEVDGNQTLIVGGDDPLQMGYDCHTSTEFIYLRN
jgi:hypothetical protein